jgi:hypothetical protein
MFLLLSQSKLSKDIYQSTLKYKRAFLPLLLLCLIINNDTRDIVINSLADAFLQVTMFVIATLYLYYFLVKKFPKLELSYISRVAPKLEVPFAALLGALPGCGGAIVVVTQYTKRQASFGSLVAVLIATMGDAAFLLIAKAPSTALLVFALTFSSGVIAGWLVNLFHAPNFLTPQSTDQANKTCHTSSRFINTISINFWRIIAAPMLVIAFFTAFQYEFSEMTANIISIIAAISALVIAVLWAFSSPGKSYQDVTSEDDCSQEPVMTKVLHDTHFISSWVIGAFIVYELSVHWLGLDIALFFKQYAIYTPLIACVVGLLPGCGPQIVVTTLYTQGVIPFSALMANAISNDGDALFPAIALAPKAALVATVYTTIPSLIIGYLIYFY